MPYLEGNVYVSGVYRHSSVVQDAIEEKLICTLPEKIPYEDRGDTKSIIAQGGQFLHDIVVAEYSWHYKNPVDLVEVVAQFQPEPLIDWSVPLENGREILLPSPVFIDTVAFGDSLADLAVI